LDQAAAGRLGQLLATHGYTTVEVDTMRAGRAEYLAVSAISP
jgi:hypothetical protein